MDSPIEEATVTDWLNALAAPTAAPAGGAAAAFAGALGAALVEMVAGLTAARERYASVRDLAARVGEQARRLRGDMLALAARTQRPSLGSRGTRPTKGNAGRAGAGAPGPGQTLSVRAPSCSSTCWLPRGGRGARLEVAERGLAGALGDAATAVFLAGGAARSAWWAVRSNLREAGEHATKRSASRRRRCCWSRWRRSERRVRRLLEERVR